MQVRLLLGGLEGGGWEGIVAVDNPRLEDKNMRLCINPIRISRMTACTRIYFLPYLQQEVLYDSGAARKLYGM